MADSIREQILAAVDVLLDAITGVTTGRNRTTDIDLSDMPAAIQLDGGHVTTALQTGAATKTLEVSVQCYVTGATEAALTAAIDVLYVQVTTALLADITLGGLASDVREVEMIEPDPMDDEQEKLFAAFSVEFEIDFETSETDPTQTP